MSLKKYQNKTIRVILSDKSEEYFNKVAYELDYGDGKVATSRQVINHCLEELALFEELSGQSVTGWLEENYPYIFEEKELKN